MKIGIDIRCLSAKKHSGVEEYIYNLLPNLFDLGSKDSFHLLYNSYNNAIPWYVKEWTKYPNVKLYKYGWPSKILNATLWSIKLPQLDRMAGNPDVMFFPNITFFSTSSRTPYVLTFHDLSFEFFPHLFNNYRRVWHYLVNPREKAQKATKIITVSNSTAKDLTSHYKIEENKIEPIYLGLSSLFQKRPPLEDFGIKMSKYNNMADEWRIRKYYKIPDNPFILYLGTIEPRKNLVSLVHAFTEFRQKSKLNYDLVLAGSKGWSYKEIFHAIEASPFRKNIYVTGPIKSIDRPALYRLANLFVFPSFFEGFGLPPLEALASGTPVICSGSTSLLEIFGDYALLVNPHDISELAWAIERGVSDTALRNSLAQKGLYYAKKFTWKKTAAKTLNTLYEAAGLREE